MIDEKQLFQKRMEAKISAYRAELEKLEAQARAKGAEAGLTSLYTIDDLQRQLSNFESRLQELEESADEHMDVVQEGISSAWDDFTDYFKKETNKGEKEN